jgi:hypothetical protein
MMTLQLQKINKKVSEDLTTETQPSSGGRSGRHREEIKNLVFSVSLWSKSSSLD